MRNFASSKALRFACALAFTLILFGAGFWAVINNHAGDDVIHEPYDYPYKVGTKEWGELKSIRMKTAACQIPDDILHRLSDEALIETIKNYPLSINLYAYNTIELGYERLKSHFNAIEELESRVNSNDGNILRAMKIEADKVASKGDNAELEDHFIGAVMNRVYMGMAGDFSSGA